MLRNVEGTRGKGAAGRGRLRDAARRIEPWQGTKRLAKFVLGLYTRPQTFEERLRALGVKVGKDVQLQPFTIDERYARLLTIEDGVSMGKGTTVYLSDGTLNTVSEATAPPPVLFGPVRICKGAVVTRNAIILAGVTIGEYAVVGAGSLVTRDVPPRTMVAGVPARVLGTVDELAPSRNGALPDRSDRSEFFIHMPNWRRRQRIGMRPEEQDLYYEENFPKHGH